MVTVNVRYKNGDMLSFVSEEAGATAAAREFLTAFHEQRRITLQVEIDRLTEQLTQQQDRLAAGVANNQPPETTKD